MLYFLAKLIMWSTLKVYFKRIVISGAEHLPSGKPIILIVNHSASFLDAMILGIIIRWPMYFYTRSDVFKPAVYKLMKAIHMIPIYNAEHSKEDLHRNDETIKEGEMVLKRREILTIFPEGISRQERILLPLKKGTARVAFHAAEQQGFDQGLQVIPAGINYSFHRFRAEVLINVGESILISDYEEVHSQNPAKAINLLTKDLEKKFAETIIYVDQPERTDLINQLLAFFKNDMIHRSDYHKSGYVLRREKEVCKSVSAMDETEAQVSSEKVFRYVHRLGTLGITDLSLIHRYHSLVWHLFGLLIGLPFAIMGAITGALPVLLAKWIGDTKVYRKDFYTSVTSVVGGFSFHIWWILLVIIFTIINNWWLLVPVLFSHLTLYIAFNWWEAWRSWTAHLKYLWLRKNRSSEIEELKKLRDSFSFWRSWPHEGQKFYQ